jgi:hypothetical protein
MNDDARDAVATVAALRAARETGVLDALLDDADTPTEVAARTPVDARAASVLVDVLTDRGFFEVVDGAYEPTNRALGLLTKTDLRSIGSIPHEVDRLDAYAALPGALRSDEPVDAAREARGDDYDRNHLGALQATPQSGVNAAVSAAQRGAPAATRVVDVGGAPGTHATEFAARGATVTLRDTPERVDAARPLLARRDLTLDAGAFDADLPPTDLAFATHLAPRLDDDALDAFGAAAYDALTHDGADDDRPQADRPPVPDRALVLVEHLRDRSPRTPTRRLDALATGQPGDHRTERAIRDALQNAGFDHVEVHAVPGLDADAIVATPRRT